MMTDFLCKHESNFLEYIIVLRRKLPDW